MSRMTNKEYVKKQGSVCPFCGSKLVHSSDSEEVDTTLRYRCNCDSCGKSWAEVWKMTGYEKD